MSLVALPTKGCSSSVNLPLRYTQPQTIRLEWTTLSPAELC